MMCFSRPKSWIRGDDLRVGLILQIMTMIERKSSARAKATREGLATNAAAKRSSFHIELSRQVSQHGLAGFFGLSERFKGRAADLDGAAALMDRTPRRHEASASVKAGTVAALMTDHEGKAVAARAPYFQVLDETNDAGELHSRQIALWVGI